MQQGGQQRSGCCWRGPALSWRPAAPPPSHSMFPRWHGYRYPSSDGKGQGTLSGVKWQLKRHQPCWRSHHRARMGCLLLQVEEAREEITIGGKKWSVMWCIIYPNYSRHWLLTDKIVWIPGVSSTLLCSSVSTWSITLSSSSRSFFRYFMLSWSNNLDYRDICPEKFMRREVLPLLWT